MSVPYLSPAAVHCLIAIRDGKPPLDGSRGHERRRRKRALETIDRLFLVRWPIGPDSQFTFDGRQLAEKGRCELTERGKALLWLYQETAFDESAAAASARRERNRRMNRARKSTR